MTSIANAACTPTPDCATIGYTETGCEGDSLKCPFDISKLYCIPCDSSFKYECSGANMVGGIGSSCGRKYVSCECVSGATFSEGNCECGEAYKYACNGGMEIAVGESCDGKYVKCSCLVGEWSGTCEPAPY